MKSNRNPLSTADIIERRYFKKHTICSLSKLLAFFLLTTGSCMATSSTTIPLTGGQIEPGSKLSISTDLLNPENRYDIICKIYNFNTTATILSDFYVETNGSDQYFHEDQYFYIDGNDATLNRSPLFRSAGSTIKITNVQHTSILNIHNTDAHNFYTVIDCQAELKS